MNDLAPTNPDPNIERDEPLPQVAVGQWYWVQSTRHVEDEATGEWVDEACEWLGCVMQLGSNFVGLNSPHNARGHRTARVHFDDFWTELRFEPNPDAVIQGKIAYYQGETNRLMGEVQAITARLGLNPNSKIAAPGAAAPSSALVVLSGQSNINEYKNALVVAKETTLPALFEAIKKSNENLTTWLTAGNLPMLAAMEAMKGSTEVISDRIFSVSLYAGLTEDVVKCADGEPAAFTEKLHVMQRRLFMDEECLLDYGNGGLDFDGIEKFDAWLARPDNRDRILPFPRCLVAMRVRRSTKERQWEGSMLSAFVNLELENADTFTFLYIRNGEQVWRLSCDMDFGAMIFPDKALYDPSEPKMVKMFAHRVDKIIATTEYEHLCAEYEKAKAEYEAWRQVNPANSGFHYRGAFSGIGGEATIAGQRFRPSDWSPFDPSNVEFDDCMAEVEKQIKEYNRIGLIIQGLYDRSEVLHPHPPVKTWDPAGFARAIELVYDANMVLTYGEAPDFEAYRTKCNATLAAGCVVVGQQRAWMEKEAERENARQEANWRIRNKLEYTVFKPEGNPGPGMVAKIDKWMPGARKATFNWERERMARSHYGYRANTGAIAATITVPASRLLNVSAYKPGDFRQFFRDPRTREQYLCWAPLLLAAEDFHLGKLKVNAGPTE